MLWSIECNETISAISTGYDGLVPLRSGSCFWLIPREDAKSRDIPNANPTIIESLDPEQVEALIEVLVRLMVQTAQTDLTPEESDHD